MSIEQQKKARRNMTISISYKNFILGFLQEWIKDLDSNIYKALGCN